MKAVMNYMMVSRVASCVVEEIGGINRLNKVSYLEFLTWVVFSFQTVERPSEE